MSFQILGKWICLRQLFEGNILLLNAFDTIYVDLAHSRVQRNVIIFVVQLISEVVLEETRKRPFCPLVQSLKPSFLSQNMSNPNGSKFHRRDSVHHRVCKQHSLPQKGNTSMENIGKPMFSRPRTGMVWARLSCQPFGFKPHSTTMPGSWPHVAPTPECI